MIRYIVRRTLQIVPVLFGLSIAVFLMLRLIPGDVVDVILGSEGSASPSPHGPPTALASDPGQDSRPVRDLSFQRAERGPQIIFGPHHWFPSG